MLQTINGFDLLLVLIITGLVIVIALQRHVIRDLRLDLFNLVDHANGLAWALEESRRPPIEPELGMIEADTDCPRCESDQTYLDPQDWVHVCIDCTKVWEPTVWDLSK
jgi:hypothetical protein